MVTPIENLRMLLFVIVQDQDVEPAKAGLDKIGLNPWVLPSAGGFLRKRNNTLLIACSDSQLLEVNEALHQSCRQRIEYLNMPLDSHSMAAPLAFPMPITVGGAAIFSFEVEHEEEIP